VFKNMRAATVAAAVAVVAAVTAHVAVMFDFMAALYVERRIATRKAGTGVQQQVLALDPM
jgi:hypothetical protein